MKAPAKIDWVRKHSPEIGTADPLLDVVMEEMVKELLRGNKVSCMVGDDYITLQYIAGKISSLKERE